MKQDKNPNDLFYYYFNGFPDGILILDHRHHCLAINGSAFKLLGLPRSHHLSKKNIDRLQFVRELSGRLNQKQAGNGLEKEFELRLTGPRARIRELGVRIRPNFTPGCHLVVLHDITGRKQTEEALRKHTQMLDLANDTIMIRDLNDHITYWNHGAERLYGWTKEQAICTRFNAFLRFSGSPISSISRSAVPSLSGSWSATRSSALLSVVGASLLGPSIKASSSWFFCRFLLVNPIPYSRSHLPFLPKGTVPAFTRTFPDRRPLPFR